MSPSTTVPQDAFKGARRPGWWRCYLCQPTVEDRGSKADFYAHYNRLHYTEPKGETS